jgi:hypothetical protein
MQSLRAATTPAPLQLEDSFDNADSTVVKIQDLITPRLTPTPFIASIEWLKARRAPLVVNRAEALNVESTETNGTDEVV